MTVLPAGVVAAPRSVAGGSAVHRRAGVGYQVGLGSLLAVLCLVLQAEAPGILAVAGVATLAVAVLLPPAGLAALALLLPFRELDFLSPPGMIALLVGATAVGCIVRLPVERPALRVSPGVVLLVGYVALSAVSLVPWLTGNPSDWFGPATLEFIHMASGAAAFLIATYLFRTVPARAILMISLASAVAVSVIAYAGFADWTPVTAAVQRLLDVTGEGRAHGVFSDSNYFGFFAAQALVMAVGMASTERRGVRIALLAAAIVIAVALGATLSRSAYLGAAAGLLALLALRNWRLALVAGAAAVLFVGILYPVFMAARLSITAGSVDLSAYLDQQRSEQWRAVAFEAGLRLFATAPVFGIGYGVFHFRSVAYMGFSPTSYSHNQWINVLAEQGLVGAALVLGIIVSLIVAMWRSSAPLRNTGLAMLAGYAVAASFLNSGTSIQTSGVTWLVFAAVLTRRRSPRPDAAGDPVPPREVLPWGSRLPEADGSARE